MLSFNVKFQLCFMIVDGKQLKSQQCKLEKQTILFLSSCSVCSVLDAVPKTWKQFYWLAVFVLTLTYGYELWVVTEKITH